MRLIVGLLLLYSLSEAAYAAGASHTEQDPRRSFHTSGSSAGDTPSPDPYSTILFAEEAGGEGEEPVDAEALATLYLKVCFTACFMAGLWLRGSQHVSLKDGRHLLFRGGRSILAGPHRIPMLRDLCVLRL